MKPQILQAAGLLIALLATCGNTAMAQMIADDNDGTLKKLGLELTNAGGKPQVLKVSGIAEASGLKKDDTIVNVGMNSATSATAVAALKTEALTGNFKLTIDPAANRDVDMLVMLPQPGQPALDVPQTLQDFGFKSFTFNQFSYVVIAEIDAGSQITQSASGISSGAGKNIKPSSTVVWSSYPEFLSVIAEQAGKGDKLTLDIGGNKTATTTRALTNNEFGNALDDFGITELSYNLITTGLKVKSRTSGSIASDIGISESDQILKIGPAAEWTSLASIQRTLEEVTVGLDEMTLSIADGGASTARDVNLAREDTVKAALRAQGLVLADGGGTVTAGNASAEAFAAGIRDGDTVTHVNGTFFKETKRLAHAAWRSLKDTSKVTLLVRSATDRTQTDITLPRQSAAAPASAGGSDTLQSLTRGLGDRKTGEHIAFPEFVGPAPVDTAKITGSSKRSLRNEVVTARVELYYFRDAHRVAQIINRNIKSYNAAAVSTLQRAAESARDDFESAKFLRKEAEQTAREAAIDLRQKENRLATLVGELRSQLQVRRALDSTRDRIADLQTELAGTTKTADKDRLDAEIARLNREKDQLDRETGRFQGGPESTQALQSEMQSLLGDIEQQKALVIEKQAESRKKENEEELAAKTQFRREVSAAKIDPDTYVPGDLNSVDPVSQVSISVIGEGVIHLRGPRAGVVRIRQMLNQIDHPVGQVKIGIMTIQLNGESGARMDNTVRRMEGHLSRGRFLTNVSENIFRRAVAEVSANVATQTFRTHYANGKASLTDGPISGWALDGENERHKDEKTRVRWHAYLSSFFGADFLEEIADVYDYSVTFDPFNKLVSLSSADSLTLAEAMLITGLAKGEHRQAIGARFQYYLRHYLPEMDARWIETNRIKKSWDPRAWGDELCSRKKILAHGEKNYRFNSIMTLFDRDYRSLAEQNCLPTEVFEMQRTMFSESQSGDPTGPSDRLNSLQREVVKLVQGMTIEAMLRSRRESLIKRRELLVEAGKGLTGAEAYIVDTEIDDLTDRQLDAMDALRGRKAAMDRLIKQAVIAMEDDVYAQFYNPAIDRIRMATEEWDVELGTVERTTILTNNRAFGKVAPQATFEFDLPKRDIAIAEALKSAYALHKDLGPLLGDPNFATLTNMFAGQSISGSTVDGSIKSILPGLSTSGDQQTMLYADSSVRPQFGTELEKLVPDPAIYKFETGTGFEVRPVVQPDGQSVVFDFDYMYTTDLLEPTRPDERKLGRVKRHFVNTEVQLGNLEWREISRYEVSLKAARNGRGVPLLEDIPILGLAFRPLPQAKKSIQKNVIVGQASIYPTIEDLLGLRPGATARINVQGVGETINTMFDKSEANSSAVESLLNRRVNEALGIKPLQPATKPVIPGPAQPQMPRLPAVIPGNGASLIPMTLPSVSRLRAAPPAEPRYPTGRSLIEKTGFWKPAGSAPLNVASPRPSREVRR